MNGIPAQDFSLLYAIAPVLTLTVAVLVLILADVFARMTGKDQGLGPAGAVNITLAFTAVAAMQCLYLLWKMWSVGSATLGELFMARGSPDSSGAPAWVSGALVVDGFAMVICLLVCVVVVLACLHLIPYLTGRGIYRVELFPLLLLSAVGMMILALSRDLLITFIAIEILSLPLYVLCGLDERRESSKESALKYFLLGAFASGFLIYGAALVYGAVAHLNYRAIAHYLSHTPELSGILTCGIALVGLGLCFKLALVPFHAWLPDVYQGAPTPITAFMAAGVKISVFAAAVRLTIDALGGLDARYWQGSLAIFAVASMVVGNLFALHQMSAKRLLAYSAITHTGYLTVGLCAGTQGAAEAIVIYLVAYYLAAMGAFVLISYLSPPEQDDIYLDEMHDLSQRSPVCALALAVFLISMAGLPLTAGFIGKLAVFTEAWRVGLHALVIIALLNSVVSAYFYLRFLVAMYMQPKAPGAALVNLGKMPPPYVFSAAFTGALTLLLGVLPGLVYGFASLASFGS